MLDGVGLIALDDVLLAAAAELDDAMIRSLDAIHLAAAFALGDELGELITYDRRMADAAKAAGIEAVAPA